MGPKYLFCNYSLTYKTTSDVFNPVIIKQQKNLSKIWTNNQKVEHFLPGLTLLLSIYLQL